ncbi:MAG: hypothetical protein J6P72_09765 [Firmicutes bacterium]|nr:hypothetical protein [Bacillota bacterium]
MKLFALLTAFLTSIRIQAKETIRSQSGMATIEVLLIIAVLIALVILFRGVIIGFVSGLLDNISSQGSSFDPAGMVP